jgi:hypothetical protein
MPLTHIKASVAPRSKVPLVQSCLNSRPGAPHVRSQQECHLVRGSVTRRRGLVGGKNSSLGEMVQQLGSKGIDVPPGFATTSDAFRAFIKANNLNQVIADAMEMLDSGKRTLAETGTAVRAAIVAGDWPDDIREAILSAYRELAERTGNTELSVAVRSAPPPRTCPMPASPASRRPSSMCAGEGAARHLPALLRLAVHRPGDHLPQPSRASTTRRWRCRSACSRWCAPTSAARA